MESTNTPPAPDEDGWDEWVEAQLADVDYDTALGKRLAEDAYRVVAGELSETEFHTRHADAVEAEFGVDERPTKHAVAAQSSNRTNPSRARSRRNVLQALGVVAAVGTSSLAGCTSIAATEADDAGTKNTTDDGIIDKIEHDKQLGMVIDTDRCIACLACSEACKAENNTSRGVHWTYVFRWSDNPRAEYWDPHDGGMTRPCQHCANPSCTYVCPTQARYKREQDGLVLTNYDVCIGCRYCQVACPYGVNYFQWGEPDPVELGQDDDDGIIDVLPENETEIQADEDDGIIDYLPPRFVGNRTGADGKTVGGNPPTGVMGKCTFCVHRQDSGDPDLVGTTACEDACPVDAIHFGDINNPHDAPQQHLNNRPDLPRTHLLEETGNQPNITYIGPQPSRRSKPVQGPVSYEELGMTEHRREVIDSRFKEEVGNND